MGGSPEFGDPRFFGKPRAEAETLLTAIVNATNAPLGELARAELALATWQPSRPPARQRILSRRSITTNGLRWR